jgi:hypothetical protein
LLSNRWCGVARLRSVDNAERTVAETIANVVLREWPGFSLLRCKIAAAQTVRALNKQGRTPAELIDTDGLAAVEAVVMTATPPLPRPGHWITQLKELEDWNHQMNLGLDMGVINPAWYRALVAVYAIIDSTGKGEKLIVGHGKGVIIDDNGAS